jgi:hypothetical protein
MRVLTDEEKLELENKTLYSDEKSKLLKVYKSYDEDLEYADDSFEEELILAKKATLSKEIKLLASKIKEIEKLEVYV